MTTETAATQNRIPAIDVHVHFVPAFYQKALEDANQMQTDGVPVPVWNPQKQLEMMDRMNIAVAMLTISSPGLYPQPGPRVQRKWSRIGTRPSPTPRPDGRVAVA